MAPDTDAANNVESGGAAQDQNGASTPGSAGSPPSGEQRQPESDHDQHTRQGGTHWLEYLTAFFAFVAAAGSVSAVIVGYWQWSAMTQSNAINREAFTSVQRAFVTVASFDTPIRLSEVPGKPTEQFKTWWFIPNVKNSGNTPTKNMKYSIGATCPAELTWGMAGGMSVACDFTRDDLLDPVDVFKRNPKQEPFAAILGPQSSIELGGVGINENSLRAIMKGFKMYVFGLIYYNDIFPETAKHVTKFCYQIGANLSDKGEIVSSFGFCAHWNCADDECADDRQAWQADVARGKIKKPFEIPPGATPFTVDIPMVPTQPQPGPPEK